ncbi:uncharacterized protein [Centruroides vittatus]|uniref:uncharacterized protein n=1 Tax=Centruroides vittatus TaxID=120091 RepID=UPI00350EC250
MGFIERQLQTSLNRIDNWSKINGFTFNAEKTSCIHFCRRRGLHLDPEIHLNGVKIPIVNEAKFLGVVFDQKLTFLSHLRNLKSRCLKSLNLLKVLCCSSWGADKCLMLRIYRALVRSKLDYGSVVYGSTRESTLRMLDPIHHQALRLCTGAFRTSPVQSLYVDAYEPPLSLRREQLSLFYYIKQKSQIKSSVDCIVSDTQLIRLFAARPSSVPTFSIRMENVSSTIDLDMGNISQPELYSISPWSTPVINVDLSLKQFPKESTPDYMYRQYFAEIRHRDRNLIPIYTDGSKSDDYVGSAFVCQNEIVAEQIAPNSSIFTAELQAIYLALKYINRKGHRCCMIYTDSVSALQALISYEPSSHSIVIKIRKLICHLFARNFSIKFCWVPGHVGIRGNEEADAAAKSARPSQHTMFIEGGDLKLVVKKRLEERWQNVWNVQVHNKLHEIKPVIENWTQKKPYDRRSEVILTRLRIGHTRLTHQYLLKGDDQPVCQYCNCDDDSHTCAGGGVAILVSNHILSLPVQITTELQAVAVRISIGVTVTVSFMYLPPDVRVNKDELDDLVEQLPTPFLLLGHKQPFNGHNPMWGSPDINLRGRAIERFIADCSDTQLKGLSAARSSSIPTFDIRMENVSSMIDVDTSNISQLFPKETTLDYIYRQHFAEIQHHYRNLIFIYTNGFKSDDYVGLAFVCQNEIVAEQIALNSFIFTAELQAIYLALKYINRKGHRRCVIYTDSVSALQALISREPSSHSIVIKIRKLFCHLIASNIFVKFCWVPGHVGIRGNEEADSAAKSASPSQHTMFIEGGDLKLVVKKRLEERWQNVWNEQVHNKLHEIKPIIENWTHNKQYDRRSGVILTRLRIGHTRLTHQYFLKGDDQPVCQYCICTVSVKHILCNCVAFDQSRRQHFGNASLREILGHRPNLDKILNFLKVININREI